MSKSIIVIDTPSRCGDCRFADFGKCWGSKSYIHLSPKDRPKECPLRPLPSRKNNDESVMVGSIQMDIGYTLGWNDCLEELEKC